MERSAEVLGWSIRFGKPKDGYTRRSLVTFASLVVLVLLFAPHQFAFLVLFLVHFDTTVRSWAETATAKVSTSVH